MEASRPPSDKGVQNQRRLDEWSHSMGTKQTSTVRVLFQNVGGFQQDEEMEVKLEALRCLMLDRDVDIFGFTESNTCWDVLPEEQ